MTTVTSVLNFAALVALSCCNAALHVASAADCRDPSEAVAAAAAVASTTSTREDGRFAWDWLSDLGPACVHRGQPQRAAPAANRFADALGRLRRGPSTTVGAMAADGQGRTH